MIRFSVFVSLMLCVTAKPYKPWRNIPGEAVQDILMSKDDEGKLTWRVEVEPPENIADTVYDIDPSMKIWKSMAEVDKDERYHPSVEDLLRAQVQNQHWPPAAAIQTEPLKERMKLYREPEEDRDHIDHPALLKTSVKRAEHNTKPEQRVAYSEPERDQDDLYHPKPQLHLPPAPPVPMEPMRNKARIHFEPEVDMDALYHGDVPQLIPRQENVEAEAAAVLPPQRKHSEPEEDRDGLYHQ